MIAPHRRRQARILLGSACLAAALGLAGAARAADYATGLAPCKSTFPTPGAETPSQITALDLLGSVTQILAPRARGLRASNLATTVAINNGASPAVRERALVDSLITDSNASTLADGLGARMADIYRRKAPFESDDDGRTRRCGEIGPAVSAVIARANAQSGGDSNAAKFAFGDGLHGAYVAPPGGTLDVLGKAYGRPIGAPGADPNGDARPFQTAPLDATSGPRIETYDGVDFFGTRMNTRAVLVGASAPGQGGSDLTRSPSFPSGHTTFGYTEALTLAMMVPERLRALAYRGSEYGNSRIVLGAHYALDVIAGRTLATYDLAQDLAGQPHYAEGVEPFPATLARAAADLRSVLKQNGCPDIALCARDPIVRAGDAAVLRDGRLHPADPREAYAFRLTYGLAPLGVTDRPPEPVPEAAGFLLQSRFPYLTPAQRREILRTTEGPSGYFLDASPIDGAPLAAAPGPTAQAQAGVYSRLDLFAAAGGYAALADQVVVDQDPAAMTNPGLAPFADLARFDDWSNDIGGPGGLTKRGGGTLRLSGRDTFAGPAVIEGGILDIAGSLASRARVAAGGTLAGTGSVGDVVVAAGGILAPGSAEGRGTLSLGGSLTFDAGGALSVRAGGDDTVPAKVRGRAALDGAKLVITTRAPIRPGTSLIVLTAQGGVTGTFADVTLDTPGLRPRLAYGAKSVQLTFEPGPRALAVGRRWADVRRRGLGVPRAAARNPRRRGARSVSAARRRRRGTPWSARRSRAP